jgi:hypothetical protein
MKARKGKKKIIIIIKKRSRKNISQDSQSLIEDSNLRPLEHQAIVPPI